ncbi:MAG: AAA family ATPase [Isosphaeraceae bacterium]
MAHLQVGTLAAPPGRRRPKRAAATPRPHGTPPSSSRNLPHEAPPRCRVRPPPAQRGPGPVHLLRDLPRAVEGDRHAPPRPGPRRRPAARLERHGAGHPRHRAGQGLAPAGGPLRRPPDVPERRFATVADLRGSSPAVGWTWPGWIPASRVVGVAASEGTGKTRFLLDLARISTWASPGPTASPPPSPPAPAPSGSAPDGHQDEIAETLPGFGLPDDAVVFPAHPDEPYDGTSLDDGELVGEGASWRRRSVRSAPGWWSSTP